MATRKTGKRPKHIPVRTCVGCKKVLPKRQLIRLVGLSGFVQVDPTAKKPGRGAYLHNLRSCWEKGLKGSLSSALRVYLTQDDLARLSKYAESLPEDDEIIVSDKQG